MSRLAAVIARKYGIQNCKGIYVDRPRTASEVIDQMQAFRASYERLYTQQMAWNAFYSNPFFNRY